MNGEHLRSVLEGARPQLESALAEAEAELDELDSRRADLLVLIGQARAALGLSDTPGTASGAGARGLTLHEALAQVLREHNNAWTTARELADEVNARALYRKRDGSQVEANQVHARTKNYADMFEKDGSRIRLRAG
jgi:hypothetical protein